MTKYLFDDNSLNFHIINKSLDDENSSLNSLLFRSSFDDTSENSSNLDFSKENKQNKVNSMVGKINKKNVIKPGNMTSSKKLFDIHPRFISFNELLDLLKGRSSNINNSNVLSSNIPQAEYDDEIETNINPSEFNTTIVSNDTESEPLFEEVTIDDNNSTQVSTPDVVSKQSGSENQKESEEDDEFDQEEVKVELDADHQMRLLKNLDPSKVNIPEIFRINIPDRKSIPSPSHSHIANDKAPLKDNQMKTINPMESVKPIPVEKLKKNKISGDKHKLIPLDFSKLQKAGFIRAHSIQKFPCQSINNKLVEVNIDHTPENFNFRNLIN